MVRSSIQSTRTELNHHQPCTPVVLKTGAGSLLPPRKATAILVTTVNRQQLSLARKPCDYVHGQMAAGAGVVGFAAACVVCLCWLPHPAPRHHYLLWFLGLTVTPMIGLDLLVNRVHRRASTGLTGMAAPVAWGRCLVKCLGLLAALLTLGVIYRIIPEYRKPFYRPCWQALQTVALPALPLVLAYIVWIDRRMAAPQDAYWHAGLVALGRWREIDGHYLGCHAASWAVKGFFLPLMLAGGAQNLETLVDRGLDGYSFDALYVTGLNLLLALDVVYGALGYLLTLRLLDAHVRSVEPTAAGWVAALCCYPPFAPLLQGAWLNYRGTIGWQECGPWSRNPVFYVSWGFAILMLHGIYVWSTCSFGCRFSNLTNRGIVVDGPYRYLKHPAYVSKNLAWWLMYVPFAAFGTWQETIHACLLLGVTNCIYAARAWTEERHLSSDPSYLAYRHWIKVHGLVARLGARLHQAGKFLAQRTASSPR